MSRHWPLLLRLLTTSSPIFPPVLVHLDDLPPFAILSSGATNVHVMSLANVFDVLWDGSVSPNAMFVHQLNQFTRGLATLLLGLLRALLGGDVTADLLVVNLLADLAGH